MKNNIDATASLALSISNNSFGRVGSTGFAPMFEIRKNATRTLGASGVYRAAMYSGGHLVFDSREPID